MGAFYQRLLSCFIIPLLVVICESFPYVKKGSLGTFDEKENKKFDDEAGKLRAEIDMLLTQDRKTTVNFYDRAINTILEKELHNAKYSDNFNFVHSRTENAIRSLIKSLFNKTSIHTQHPARVAVPSKKLAKSRNNKNTDSFKYLLSKFFNSARLKPSDVHLNDSPKVSKRDYISSELRRRRSFDWDTILADDGDILFGAHTTPCDIADKYYCMNGGTCQYLPALQTKTCR